MRRLIVLGFTIAAMAAGPGKVSPAKAEPLHPPGGHGTSGIEPAAGIAPTGLHGAYCPLGCCEGAPSAAKAVAPASQTAEPHAEKVRVSVVHEVRLGFLRGERQAVPGMGEEFLAIGIGPVMGLDVDVKPGVSLCCKLGFLMGTPRGEEGALSGEGPDLGGPNMYAGLGVTFRFRTSANKKQGGMTGG